MSWRGLEGKGSRRVNTWSIFKVRKVGTDSGRLICLATTFCSMLTQLPSNTETGGRRERQDDLFSPSPLQVNKCWEIARGCMTGWGAAEKGTLTFRMTTACLNCRVEDGRRNLSDFLELSSLMGLPEHCLLWSYSRSSNISPKFSVQWITDATFYRFFFSFEIQGTHDTYDVSSLVVSIHT